MKETLGHKIKALRKIKKLSQKRLADKADLSQQHISRIENGLTFPSVSTLNKIANVLNTPIDDLVDIYKDNGITGTEMECRDDFNRMYADCADGKLDLILTKSISRFARNIVDSIKYIRELKALGISIYFEKENIDTGEMTSEMIVALYSVFAQAESESTSNNVKLGKRFNYRSGKVPMMYGTLLGYRSGTAVRT